MKNTLCVMYFLFAFFELVRIKDSDKRKFAKFEINYFCNVFIVHRKLINLCLNYYFIFFIKRYFFILWSTNFIFTFNVYSKYLHKNYKNYLLKIIKNERKVSVALFSFA